MPASDSVTRSDRWLSRTPRQLAQVQLALGKIEFDQKLSKHIGANESLFVTHGGFVDNVQKTVAEFQIPNANRIRIGRVAFSIALIADATDAYAGQSLGSRSGG